MQLLDHFDETKLEAGCDEAGRGCLAGPVVCASVILPKGFSHELLNDSKQLSEKSRNLLRPIIEKEAIAFSVQFLHPDEIAELNILKASLTGMYRAAIDLKVRPELLLIDGNKALLSKDIPSVPIIKGDGKYKSIAAASVLAKTYRDEYMENLHHEFPQYDWKVNKGYPTKAHRLAIHQHGPCIHHRMGFNLLGKGQLSLFGE
ncbi:ribonuclease HII [Fluviicola sp.]|uniref:ribonuclease HII n=1 Tax=Fluviicola sp. TaxID=1917219 RepID=UPI0031D423EF